MKHTEHEYFEAGYKYEKNKIGGDVLRKMIEAERIEDRDEARRMIEQGRLEARK
jgi:hypothetical protein